MHDDLALYVLGALEDPSAFEAHLETCAQCRAELAELRGTLDVLDANVPRPLAPAGLRERTLAAVRAVDVHQPTDAPGPVAGVVQIDQARLRRARITSIAAVAALAVVVAGVGYRSITREGFSADRIIALAAADGGAARGEARIDDTAAGQVIELDVSGLPDAPAGSHYECWWVGEGDGDDVQNRVSAGTFRSGTGTYRMQSSADAARFTKMGVTLEPDDGNPLRTGSKVLVSEPPPGAAPASGSVAPTSAPTTAASPATSTATVASPPPSR